jgi:hypothetical protein
MSDKPRDLTLERVNRLTAAVADLTESHAQQGRMMIRILEELSERMGGFSAELTGIRAELVDVKGLLRELASEQVLLGNRVENAFSKALRANIRLDEMEDATPPPAG